jgi:hypothetical protein
MFCNSCGKQNPDNSTFCCFCGSAITRGRPIQIPAPAPAPAVKPAPDSSPVSLQKPEETPGTETPPATALKQQGQNDSMTKVLNIIAILLALGGLLFAFYYLITNGITFIRLLSVMKDKIDSLNRSKLLADSGSKKTEILFKSGLVPSIVTFALRTLVALASMIGFGTVIIGKGLKASVIVPLATIMTSIVYIISFEFFYTSGSAFKHGAYYAKYTGHVICLTEFAAVIGAIVLIIYIFSKSKIAGGIAAFLNGTALLVTFVNFIRIIFKLVSWASDRMTTDKTSLFTGKRLPEKLPASPTTVFNYLYGFFFQNTAKGWTYSTLFMKLDLVDKKFSNPLDLVGFGAMFCVTGTLFALTLALLFSKGMAKKAKTK